VKVARVANGKFKFVRLFVGCDVLWLGFGLIFCLVSFLRSLLYSNYSMSLPD